MPESKSKRKKKGRRRRPPSVHTPPKRKKTPRWAIPAFFGTMGTGVAVIILNYMPILGGFRNWLLFLGLGLMGVGFAVSTQIR